MRIIYVLIIPSLIALSASSASGQVNDSLLYARAYEYIINDSIGRQYNIVPSNKLTHTDYKSLILNDGGFEQTDMDSLKTISMIDILQIDPDIRHQYSAVKILRLALEMKLNNFDKKSIGGKSDTLRYTFPHLINPDTLSTLKRAHMIIVEPFIMNHETDTLPRCLRSHTNREMPAELSLTFSNRFKNEFFVELNEDIVYFGDKYKYFFRFNSDGTIKNVELLITPY